MKRGAWVHALGALAVLLGAVLLTPAGRAAAHAGYDHSVPAKDEVVPTTPSRVDVYFNENVFSRQEPPSYYVRVFADDGTQVSAGNGTIDDNNRKHISASLPANLAQGRYIVEWFTTSDEDNDKDQGMYCFYIGVQPTAAQQAQCASFAPTPVPTIAVATQSPPVSTQPAATAVPTSASKGGGGGGSSAGVIIGVVAGVIVAMAVVGGAGLWWRSRRA